MTKTTFDRQIEDYLARLRAALEGVWAPRRDQIIADVEDHIAAAIEEMQDPTEADIAKLLERIGDPEEIAAAAISDEPGIAASAKPGQPSGLGTHEILAVFFLICGVVVPFVGWVVGLILLWTSRVWNRRDKLIGTLFLPGGLLLAALGVYLVFLRPATVNTACASASAAGPLGNTGTVGTSGCSTDATFGMANLSLGVRLFAVAVILVLALIPVLAAVYLLRVPRIRADQTAAGRPPRSPRSRLAILLAPVLLIAAVAVIVATDSWPYQNLKDAVLRESPQYVQLFPVQTTASSYVSAHSPANVDDGDTTTSWATTTPIGASVKLIYAGTESFQAVGVISGDQFPPASFSKFARPKKVELIFASGAPEVLTLSDTPTFQNFRFSPRQSSFLELKILSLYPGRLPCAITELTSYTMTG
jgi:hypothetical protein